MLLPLLLSLLLAGLLTRGGIERGGGQKILLLHDRFIHIANAACMKRSYIYTVIMEIDIVLYDGDKAGKLRALQINTLLKSARRSSLICFKLKYAYSVDDDVGGTLSHHSDVHS